MSLFKNKCYLCGMIRMKRILFLLLCAVGICLTGCGSRQSRPVVADRVVYQPEYATGFVIMGSDSARSVIIRSYNPWQGADSVVSELFVRRGDEDVPEGFAGQVLEGDASRVVAMSSTHIAMLDAIGRPDIVKGVSGLDYVSTPYIRQRRDSVADVGFDGSVNYELLLSLRPDLVLLYGVNGASAMEGKLRELGVPFMYVGDYVEQSPLGKAEWVVAMAELTGDRKAGADYLTKIAAAYDSIRDKVAGQTVDSPLVMVNTPYSDQWFMPSDKSCLARMISDAGGEYIYNKNHGTASVPVGIEEAYLLASKADVWINTGQATSLADIRRDCHRFMDAGCVRNGQVYNDNRRSTPGGGNDVYESGAVRPDLVLRDMVKIFHPELLPDSVGFVYYQKLK